MFYDVELLVTLNFFFLLSNIWLIQIILGDALFREREYRRAIVRAYVYCISILIWLSMWKWVFWMKFSLLGAIYKTLLCWRNQELFSTLFMLYWCQWQHTYKQALQYYKMVPKQTTSLRSPLSTSNRSSSPNSFNIPTINENEVDWSFSLQCLAYRFGLVLLII